MRSKWLFAAVLAALFALPAAAQAAGSTIDVTQAGYGAVGNGTTNDRAAIQRALDDVAADGGGTVVIPSGRTFLTGSLRIGSATTVQLDGTLLQSQDTADYSPAVERGHDRAIPRAQWDHMWLANQPFLFSSHSTDVRIEGSGTLRMTREVSENDTIHISPVGFYRVDGYEIHDITITDAMGYNMALYSTRHGLVEGVTAHVAVAGHGSSDGFSIQNSQHIRITGNDIISSDDGIYVWSSYRDPRGTSWWSSDEPQPSKDIEIDHNVVQVSPACCKAVAIIAWGGQAPDLNQVAISDVNVHHNRLQAPEAVGCWCDDVMTAEVADQAPMARIRFADNEYVGATDSTMAGARIADLETDFGQSSTLRLQNQDFSLHGPAWWSVIGDPVVEQRPDGDWAARVVGAAGTRSAIYQGIGLGDRTLGRQRGRLPADGGGRRRRRADAAVRLRHLHRNDGRRTLGRRRPPPSGAGGVQSDPVRQRADRSRQRRRRQRERHRASLRARAAVGELRRAGDRSDGRHDRLVADVRRRR